MRTGLPKFFYLIICTSFLSCTELVSLDTPGVTPPLVVVDRSINNLQEGNWIRLSTSTPGLDAVGSNTLGADASVVLFMGMKYSIMMKHHRALIFWHRRFFRVSLGIPIS